MIKWTLIKLKNKFIKKKVKNYKQFSKEIFKKIISIIDILIFLKKPF